MFSTSSDAVGKCVGRDAIVDVGGEKDEDGDVEQVLAFDFYAA
jgi:hypothetical protein